MSHLTTVEWITARRDHLRRRWERATRTDLKVKYGAQKAELNRVLDYIAAHPPRSEKEAILMAGDHACAVCRGAESWYECPCCGRKPPVQHSGESDG